MSEKRVSVRLSATGGRQVRGELEGVGDAGAKGMGRLSREAERANAKLAAFARRARVAAAAATAAVAAAGVAMVRNGLQTIDAQAKLAQSLDTTVASVQVLERAAELSGSKMADLEAGSARLTRRLSLFASDGSGPAAKAIERLNLNAEELLRLPLDKRIETVTNAIRENADASEQAALFSQLFGDRGFVAFQRLDSATLRQATDDLKSFGAIVSESDAEQIERTNDAISRLGLIWRGISNQLAVAAAPALEAVADAMAAAANVTGPLGKAISALMENIGRITAYAGGFVALLAGKWVVGMGLAAAKTLKVAGALTVLRGALARTGVGLAIVAIGELGARFLEMQSGASAAGKSIDDLDGKTDPLIRNMRSLQVVNDNLVLSLGDEIKQSQLLEIALGRSTNMSVEAAQKKLSEAMSRNENVKAIIAERRALALGSDDYADVLRRIKETQDALNATGFPARDIAVPMRSEAFEQLQQRLVELNRERTEMLRSDEEMTEQLRLTSENIATIETALAAAKDGMVSFGDEIIRPIELSDRLATALTSTEGAATAAGNAAREAGRQAAEGSQEAATGWQAVTNALADYAKDAMDWGKGLGQTLVNGFQSAENAFRNFVKTGKLDFKGLVASILEDLAVLQFRNAVLGPIANALSGAFGGLGGGSTVTAAVSHAGGVVGLSGYSRQVPALAFAGAPRMHTGGIAGLRYDEVPTILQRGERVLNRREAAQYNSASGPQSMAITVNVEGARGNREIEEMVNAGVSGALQQYDRLVAPRTIARVSQDPRRSG